MNEIKTDTINLLSASFQKCSIDILAGPTGCGKSTVIGSMLLTRAYKDGKVAVIDNDYVENSGFEKGRNPDTIRFQKLAKQIIELKATIGMDVKCICCASQEMLIVEVGRLLSEGYTQIFIEGGSTSDPEVLRTALCDKFPDQIARPRVIATVDPLILDRQSDQNPNLEREMMMYALSSADVIVQSVRNGSKGANAREFIESYKADGSLVIESGVSGETRYLPHDVASNIVRFEGANIDLGMQAFAASYTGRVEAFSKLRNATSQMIFLVHDGVSRDELVTVLMNPEIALVRAKGVFWDSDKEYEFQWRLGEDFQFKLAAEATTDFPGRSWFLARGINSDKPVETGSFPSVGIPIFSFDWVQSLSQYYTNALMNLDCSSSVPEGDIGYYRGRALYAIFDEIPSGAQEEVTDGYLLALKNFIDFRVARGNQIIKNLPQFDLASAGDSLLSIALELAAISSDLPAERRADFDALEITAGLGRISVPQLFLTGLRSAKQIPALDGSKTFNENYIRALKYVVTATAQNGSNQQAKSALSTFLQLQGVVMEQTQREHILGIFI